MQKRKRLGRGATKMPKVGKKEFAYTDKGKKAAEAYAKKTGKSVKGKGKKGK